jgi:hypothetical protein
MKREKLKVEIIKLLELLEKARVGRKRLDIKIFVKGMSRLKLKKE